MITEKLQRKLTAIFSADVAGYSCLMGDDEEATVRTLNKYKEIIFGLIEHHNGRVVDSPGDNLLAEFSSVVDAVRCGVQIQEDLKLNNEELPKNRKMVFRIGINIGDVIQDRERIYGDGVNVAARIESLADPGGICISRTAYDQVKKKLNIKYEYLGEYEVKNIDEPVRVYRVRMGSEYATPKAHTASNVEEGPKAIAVLPFVNLSSDPEQEYFVDGLSEEILNCLAKISGLRVTSRTSSFFFKGTKKKLRDIANDLGVEHILEGSVRKAGDKLRITAQLIRAKDDAHLWSETYDRELKDIFVVQEDIAKTVAEELKSTLGIGDSVKQLGGTDNLEAYELYLVALGLENNQDYSTALQSINGAIEMDPQFALAWNLKAMTHIGLTLFGPGDRALTEQEAAMNAAQRAIELEPKLGNAYNIFGFIQTSKGHLVEAESAYRKALELTVEPLPGSSIFIPIHYTAVGHFKRALELIEPARRNDPLNPWVRTWYFYTIGLLGDMKRAQEEYGHCSAMFENQFCPDIISRLRIGTGNVASRDEIVSSNPLHEIVKKHLDLPEKGLEELRRIYAGDDNLSCDDFYEIALGAAYFGDTELSMDAFEKGCDIDATGLFELWLPVYRQIRQLPRIKEYLRKIGLVDYWEKFGWPDICHKLENGDFVCV